MGSDTTAPLHPLPDTFGATREALRAVACYAVSPARRARSGRIGLRPVGGGFGTPPFEDGSQIVVHGNELAWAPGDSESLTTIRAAAVFLRIEPSPDPGVGHDLPPYAPDDALAIDDQASLDLGAWYAFGQQLIDSELTSFPSGAVIGEAQIWPEHFDLALTVELETGTPVNVGFSPGDSFNASPYVYVGPHNFAGGAGDEYWNAPFGAYLPYDRLLAAEDPAGSAVAFIVEGLSSVP